MTTTVELARKIAALLALLPLNIVAAIALKTIVDDWRNGWRPWYWDGWR
ncbi:hypothetical protein ACIBEJ_13945 [Nonomuraea sp. NPDC050790]